MSTSVLIIGPPGRLRDGLRSILRLFSGISEITTADKFEPGYESTVREQPSVVILESSESLENDCFMLKKLLSNSGQSRCLVIVNTIQKAVQASKLGADAVLLQGFSTNTLYQTLVSLNVIPETGMADKPAASNRQKAAASPLSQKS